MKHLKVRIVTPEKVLVSEDYISASLPAETGQLTVLPQHIPLVSRLKAGEIVLNDEKNYKTLLSVSSGIMEVRPKSELVILADEALRAEDIDLEKAKEAKDRVEKIFEEKRSKEDFDYSRIQANLEKEMARIKVAKKYRKIKNIS